MGIFFTSTQPVLPAVKDAIRVAFLADALNATDAENQAASRTVALAQTTSPQFNPWRFGAALAIAAALLAGAIWADEKHLDDIAKPLMTSFSSFSGIVLGLLGGEAQKSTS